MIEGHRVLDAHVHLTPSRWLKPAVRAVMEARGPDAEVARFQEDARAFEAHLDAEGVDAAALVNYVSPDVMGYPPQVNDWALAYARASPRLLPMGGVHPAATPGVGAETRRLLEAGMRGMKVHPNHQLLHPHDHLGAWPALGELYAECERRRVPVTIHSGTSVFPGARTRFADPLFVDDVAIDFPRLPILLAHAGRPFWYEKAFFLARRHDNVHLEISGIPPRRLLDALPRLPELAHKGVWGSDWPGPGVRSMRDNVAQFLGLPGLSDAQKGAILWDNGARLFGL